MRMGCGARPLPSRDRYGALQVQVVYLACVCLLAFAAVVYGILDFVLIYKGIG